jgi:hypothetical protein
VPSGGPSQAATPSNKSSPYARECLLERRRVHAPKRTRANHAHRVLVSPSPTAHRQPTSAPSIVIVFGVRLPAKR